MKEKQYKICFLFLVNDASSNLHQAGEQVRAFLSRSKSEHEFVFANVSGHSGYSEFMQTKTLHDYVQSGRIHFISAEKNTLNSIFREASNLSDHASHICINGLEEIAHLGAIQTWFSNQKEAARKNSLNVLVPQKTKGKESHTFLQSLRTRAYSFWASLMMNGSHSDVVNSTLIFKTDSFQDLCEHFRFRGTSSQKIKAQLLSAASLAGISTAELPVVKKETSVSGFLKGLFSAAVVMRVNWYFLSPIREIRKNGFKDMMQSDHAIYRMMFFVLFLILGIWMPFLAQGFGISWDERAHSAMGKDILDYFVTFGKDKRCLDTTIPHHIGLINYGLSFDTFAAFVNKYISNFGEFETRHFLNAFVGFVGMVYMALAAKKLGGWRAALLALVMAFLSPYYLGHAMNNPKDIPFATGYMASLYYILAFLEEFPKPKRKTLVFLTLAIAYAISIRIAGLLMLAYLGLFTGIIFLLYAFRNDFKQAIRTIPGLALKGVLVAFAAYMLGILLWPYALQSPFENPFLALKSFTNWSLLTSYELFEGNRIYMSELPWNYIVKLILIMSPLFIWTGMILLIPALALGFKKLKPLFISMLLFACLFPIAYAYYKHSTMFNGWRHMLFAYPPLVVIAASGWDRFIEIINKRIVGITTLLLFAGLSGKTAVWCIQNHPNEYVYYNEFVGGVDGAYGNYETDPYGNCMRAGVEWLIKNEHLEHKKVLVVVNQETLTAEYYAKKMADSVTISWTREYEVNKQRWDYAILTTRTMSKNLLLSGCFPPKGTIHVIKVENTPIVAIVKRENYFLPDAYKQIEVMNTDSAEINLKKAIEYDPKNEEPYRMLAMTYLTKGNNAEAGKVLDQVLKIYPEGYIAYYLKGYMYMNLHQPDSAIPLFDKAIQYKINYADPYFAKGKALEMKKDYRLAIDQFDLAFKYGNQNYKFLNEAALAYFMMADATPDASKQNYYNKGINLYMESLKKNGNQADVYQNLGYAYQKLGDKKTSDQYFQKSMQMRSGK